VRPEGLGKFEKITTMKGQNEDASIFWIAHFLKKRNGRLLTDMHVLFKNILVGITKILTFSFHLLVTKQRKTN
jgi:hypothetical protein